MSLPTKIRSEVDPDWTHALTWKVHAHGRAVADVSTVWGISCDSRGMDAAIWHKEDPFNSQYFTSVEQALKSIGYRVDA